MSLIEESLIEEIKEKTGIDVKTKRRRRDEVYAKAVYSKIMHGVHGRSFKSIHRSLGTKTHVCIMNQINNVFPEAMINSKQYRELYYDLLNKIDPEIQKQKDSVLEAPVKLLEEILKDYSFWLKPHHKRQLESLL